MLANHGKVMTVLGAIDADAMGLTLTHEHVLVDFAGAKLVSPDRYDQDDAFELILPHLRQAKDLGCQTFVECTPSYLGKDVILCRRLSEATGLHLLTNVGYYGAGDDRYLPRHAHEESADQLAERWLTDAESIDGTAVQPGFIKIGVDETSLSAVDEKLVRAAARAHLRSGLLIMSHTGYATPAMEQIAILKEEGVHPSAWVWTHAQNENDNDAHAAAAGVGASFSTAQGETKTYYWISHGSPADPIWTYFLAGAPQWSEDTGHTVNASFHNGDVASHQEAVRAAIAAGADGIVTSSPDPGSLVQVAREANEAKIPIINMNTPGPTASFDAYVGGDLVVSGRQWAQYLVDKGHVGSDDFVWTPVEFPGATYGVQEERGIASVFEPWVGRTLTLGITWEVTDATLDQAEVISPMVDYMTAHRDRIDAFIGLGDLVTGSIKRVFDQSGVAPGEVPFVGWGNSLDTTQRVLNGCVNAAIWQDPLAISCVALSLGAMSASGIPPGFDVTTGALYEADTAHIYDDILSRK